METETFVVDPEMLRLADLANLRHRRARFVGRVLLYFTAVVLSPFWIIWGLGWVLTTLGQWSVALGLYWVKPFSYFMYKCINRWTLRGVLENFEGIADESNLVPFYKISAKGHWEKETK